METSRFADDPGDSNATSNHRVYRQVRDNVIGLLADRPDAAGLVVPACPDWTVLDLVAHLVDICGLATRRLVGRAGSSPDEGRPRDLSRLLAVWRTDGARLDRLVADHADRMSNVLVMDAFTHELDLRHCLGVPPADGHPAYPGTLEVAIGGFAGELGRRGLPPLRIKTPGGQWSAGPEGPPAATLTADRHDLYRTLTGRRTYAQIAALDWNDDPGPWMPAFTWGPFTPPTSPVEPLGGRPA